ncbi:MAG: hypothetical protein COB20_08080 [SAR86 cluster bacterium]|uniref:Uncharacterized protein n=1 Tax=SAR86 cluster bacterium TaxID=2030880 RepID=A0A2A4X4M0_9GAMM|nr:MAG: hypothetical protein COB20_08080 [SAR86 cluster bacterium]
MKSSWKDWLTIASNLAILMGILLVFWELQQNQTLARLQLTSEGFALRTELTSNLIGESPELVLAKACLKPDELTTEDRIVLAQIFQSRLSAALMYRDIESVSGLGFDIENSFVPVFQTMFNYEYGREFYQRMKDYSNGRSADLFAIGDSVLESGRVSDCALGSAVPGGF